MTTKPWYLSKILWLGFLIALLDGLKAFGVETGINIPVGITAALGGIIALLRTFSNTTLTK